MTDIRKAEKKDILQIIDFQNKMAIETEGMHLNKKILAKGVEAVFDDPNKGLYIVAETESLVIASLMLTPEWSDWRAGTFLWIQSVYVDPGFRQKGIFRKMYEYVQDIVLESPEFLGLRLYVVMNNLLAQEVYTKTGMNGNHYKIYEWIK
jgi:L-amino acid N-acyltransferase YncA